eukprot:254458-Chlamydomonas_euryale.AAC.2
MAAEARVGVAQVGRADIDGSGLGPITWCACMQTCMDGCMHVFIQVQVGRGHPAGSHVSMLRAMARVHARMLDG